MKLLGIHPNSTLFFFLHVGREQFYGISFNEIPQTEPTTFQIQFSLGKSDKTTKANNNKIY